MVSFRQSIAVLAVSLVALTGIAQAAPALKYSGHRTDVNLSNEFVGALSSLGVAVAPLKGSRIISQQARFPIPAAELDLDSAKGEIIHTGGLRLSAGATAVELSLFIIDTTTPESSVLTGLVKANGSVIGRLPLFHVQLPALSLPLPSAQKLTIPDAVLTLTAEAAAALNAVFGVSAFEPGFSIGVAHVILRRAAL